MPVRSSRRTGKSRNMLRSRTCDLGPGENMLGVCACFCMDCDPDNPPDRHCQNHFYSCHRGCGDNKP